MRKRRSINNKLDYKEKEKYKKEKNTIHKKRKKEKPV
jgi:hypothetical protein